MRTKFRPFPVAAGAIAALGLGPLAGAQQSPSYTTSYNAGAPIAVTASPQGPTPAGQAAGVYGPGGSNPYPLNGGPGMAGAPGTPGTAMAPGAVPGGGGAAGAGAGGPAPALASGLGGNVGGAEGVPAMLGDQGPLIIRQFPGFPQPPQLPPPFPPNNPPPLPSPQARSLFAPSVRGFKIAENQSPIPQDRVFYTFNFFEDVNKRLNNFFDSPINDLKVYRNVFGFEKTFFDGKGSFGARLPLNTIHAAPRPGVLTQAGTSTALGDLTVFAKYILEQDPKTGSLLSVGLAITPPTGPSRFGNAPFIGGVNPIHNTTIQPFVGYYLSLGNWFVHGFTALDVAIDPRDVTLIYNDVGLGYYLFRAPDADSFLTAVVPTVEAHINNPLNHRDEYNLFDPTGTPDIVNITSGVNVEFSRTAVFTFGFVTPVTGPRPFDFEVIGLLNVRFGGNRANRQSIVPVIGG